MIKNAKPTASKLSVLGQLCNLISPHLVCKLARETGVHSMARSFSPWSHVVSMLFAQLTDLQFGHFEGLITSAD
jgi:hypothetical protein